MSGRYLDNSFSLPCPPGLDLPPEVFSPFTSNNLKVSAHLIHPQSHFHAVNKQQLYSLKSLLLLELKS